MLWPQHRVDERVCWSLVFLEELSYLSPSPQEHPRLSTWFFPFWCSWWIQNKGKGTVKLVMATVNSHHFSLLSLWSLGYRTGFHLIFIISVIAWDLMKKVTSNSTLGLITASFIKIPAVPTAKCLRCTLFIVLRFLKGSTLLVGVVEGPVTPYRVTTEWIHFVCYSKHKHHSLTLTWDHVVLVAAGRHLRGRQCCLLAAFLCIGLQMWEKAKGKENFPEKANRP